MASLSTKESASSSEQSSSVQPSATLIEALHQKLCDPCIVPKFEQCRPPNVTQRLLSNRWILKSSVDKISPGTDEDNQADNDICSGKDDSTQMSDTKSHNGQQTNNTNNNNEPKYNTVPQRTYLTIRIEQNKQFANGQYLRCQKKLAALSSTSPKSVEAINVNRLTIQKVIDAIRNQLKEGLAACPDHGGLIQVEREVRVWMDRLNGVDSGDGDGGFKECSKNVVLDTASTSAATRAEERRRRGYAETVSSDLITEQQPSTQQYIALKRKGGDGRAQAAMDDALVEKMFMQGHGDSTNHDGAIGTNNLKWAPPAFSRVDQNAVPDDHMSDSDSYHDRKRSRHHKRSSRRYRSRSRSVERRREDRRKGERKRHHRHHHRSRDDDRKRKKRRHRSRSRSMSSGSVSPKEEEASLSSCSNTSRDRSKRRHRSDRHSSRHSKRRHKSKSHKKERRKSSKRHHRSRRERSQSVSSSSSAAAADDVDGIKERFVPPSVQHGRTEEGAGGIEGRFVPPQLSHSAQHVREEEQAIRKEDIEVDSMPKSNGNEASADTNH